MIDLKTLSVDILRSWPPYLQEKLEMQELAETLNLSLKELYAAMDKAYRNFFVMTADEDGLARFEDYYGIQPRNDSTLEDRRLEILAKMQTRLPYTKRMLNQLLKALLGEDMYTLEIKTSEYLVKVTVELRRKNQVQSVADLLRRVIPANMNYEILIRYNQYYMLTKFTYEELAAYTCDEVKESPEIKEIYLERGGELI